jgi:hypothetical protein
MRMRSTKNPSRMERWVFVAYANEESGDGEIDRGAIEVERIPGGNH